MRFFEPPRRRFLYEECLKRQGADGEAHFGGIAHPETNENKGIMKKPAVCGFFDFTNRGPAAVASINGREIVIE